jgi:predicted AAA+ superfamily ATPase
VNDYSLLFLQNPWWADPSAIHKDPRIQEFEASSVQYEPAQVLGLDLEPEAIHILTGPRQTGKSTALKLLVRKRLQEEFEPARLFYFNCDAVASRRELIELVLAFLDTIRSASGDLPENLILLDEISSVPEWPLGIKWLADGGFFRRSKVILTGSSSVHLRRSGELLPGRRRGGKDIRYLPITYFEYCRLVFPQLGLTERATSLDELRDFQMRAIQASQDPGKIHRDFLLSGGLLKVIDLFRKRSPISEPLELYRSTLLSELARAGKKEAHARGVLRKVLASLSSETSYANVAEEAELGSKNTASDYLRFLSDCFFLTELLFYNIPQKRESLKKNKKYYPSDPFFLWIFHAFVTGAGELRPFRERYLAPPLDSQLAECFVASELYKAHLATFFYRADRELDFYIPDLELGVEVKYKKKITAMDLKPLHPARRKVLVSRDTLEGRGDAVIVPASLFGLADWRRFR